jgi:type IV secretion system protein TrbD
MSDGERRIALHSSLHRQHMLLGGERELVQMTGLVAGLIAVGGLNFVSVFIAVVIWLGGLAALQRMGKADPVLSRVYRRHRLYRPYYPAASSIAALPRRIRDWSR